MTERAEIGFALLIKVFAFLQEPINRLRANPFTKETDARRGECAVVHRRTPKPDGGL
jgi:hypothetical protein